MLNTIEQFKTGRLAGLSLGDVGVDFLDAHRLHVADMQRAGSYDVFGTRF